MKLTLKKEKALSLIKLLSNNNLFAAIHVRFADNGYVLDKRYIITAYNGDEYTNFYIDKIINPNVPYSEARNLTEINFENLLDEVSIEYKQFFLFNLDLFS